MYIKLQFREPFRVTILKTSQVNIEVSRILTQKFQ